MPTADELRRAIEPGSTAYGDRQVLEQGLSDVAQNMDQGGPAPVASGGAAGPAIPPGPDDPLSMLLGGDLEPEAVPLTDGLSVGPGRGAPEAENPWTDSYTERLRAIAQFAKSPLLRSQARAALRFRVRGGDIA